MQKQLIIDQGLTIDYYGQSIVGSSTACNRFNKTIDYISTGTQNRLHQVMDYPG